MKYMAKIRFFFIFRNEHTGLKFHGINLIKFVLLIRWEQQQVTIESHVCKVRTSPLLFPHSIFTRYISSHKIHKKRNIRDI